MTDTLELSPVASEWRACVFTIGGELFALDVAAVREVVTVDEVTPVPLAPPHVLGVANLRGTVLAVVDPRAVLGLESRPAGRRLRALVVAAAGCEVALVVDDVLGLESLEDPLAHPGPSRALAGLATGVVQWRGRPLIALDAANLVAALRPIRER